MDLGSCDVSENTLALHSQKFPVLVLTVPTHISSTLSAIQERKSLEGKYISLIIITLSGCGPSCSYAFPISLICFSQIDSLPALYHPVAYKVCDELCLKQGFHDTEKWSRCYEIWPLPGNQVQRQEELISI